MLASLRGGRNPRPGLTGMIALGWSRMEARQFSRTWKQPGNSCRDMQAKTGLSSEWMNGKLQVIACLSHFGRPSAPLSRCAKPERSRFKVLAAAGDVPLGPIRCRFATGVPEQRRAERAAAVSRSRFVLLIYCLGITVIFVTSRGDTKQARQNRPDSQVTVGTGTESKKRWADRAHIRTTVRGEEKIILHESSAVRICHHTLP
jgi:hypothetical protein